MRPIIFRGKRLDNGEWVEGDYFRKYIYDRYDNGSLHHLIGWQVTDNDGEKFNDYEDVDPDTVGQYTGLKDRYGDRIWEGDVIKATGGCAPKIGAVIYKNGEFRGLYDFPKQDNVCGFCEIIGNIHDNPEFLEGGAK